MILHIVIGTLAAALILYTLFGGADYGAGILTLCPWGKDKDAMKNLISKTISPVWEANHVWFILIIVILFVGFPAVYSALTRHLHWPIVAILIGIIARGCAFTFMHYDAIKDASQKWYQRIFSSASLWTSFWLGVVLGGMSSGEIKSTGSTYDIFFSGWMNLYSILMGLFVITIFATLAAIYLLGETNDRTLQLATRKKAIQFSLGMVSLGGAVFFSSHFNEGQMVHRFLDASGSLIVFILATLLIFPLIRSISQLHVRKSRVLVAIIVSCIVFGWMNANFPIAVNIKESPLTFYSIASEAKTLEQLVTALIVGLVLILPSLGFLFKISQQDSK